MEEILNHPTRKSEPTRLVTARGRMLTVELILPVVVGRMPPWLEVLLAPHMKRFADDSWCPDAWWALMRLSFVKDWRERWGSTPEQDWFVSVDPVPSEEHGTMVGLSQELKLDMGMCIDRGMFGRHVLAPRGTWSRR
jgi:hypothetical protein